MRIKLSVIVPCLNEMQNVGTILSALAHSLEPIRADTEIVVVDDQSDDDTYREAIAFAEQNAAAPRVRVVRRPLQRRGYGAAVRYGVAHATGTYCIFVAADGVDPIAHIPDFLRRMEAGADLVQCSRYLKPGDDATIPFKYKFYQFFYRRLVRIIFGQHIRDSTYAFKMFRRVDLLGMGLIQNRFSISPEITFKVLLSGGQIEYFPAGQGTRTIGKSKFIFRREAFGYGYVLLRGWFHRMGLIWWF